jgi:Spy/CpxP family protein refolding chaperone
MFVARYASAVLVSVALASAAQAQKVPKQQAFAPPDSSAPLVAADALTKLKLSAEQQTKVNQIVKEFDEKNKDAAAKIKDQVAKLQQDAQTARQNKDKAAIKQIMEQLQTVQQGVAKLREEYEGKLVGALNDEQKKTFEEIKKDAPKPGAAPVKRPAKPADAVKKPGGVAEAGPLVPAEALTKLKLTAQQQTQVNEIIKEFDDKNKDAAAKAKEQTAKLLEEAQTAKQNNDKAAARQALEKIQEVQLGLAKLREEYEGKLVQTLTDEQKKTFEELKKDFPKVAVTPLKKKPNK